MMADRILSGSGKMSGSYNGESFSDETSSEIEVSMPEVVFKKEADKSVWFGGYLTITFTVDNSNSEGTITGLEIVDEIDTGKFTYDETSISGLLVTVGESFELIVNTDYTVSYVVSEGKGTLTISLLAEGQAGTISAGSSVKFSFRGSKVPA